MIKLIKKILFKLVIVLILIVTTISIYMFNEGYKLYNQAVKLFPIDETVNLIKSSDFYVPYDKIDDDFISAVISIEDHRFFERKGIDYIAIARALVTNIISGKLSQGGSTITQQLAKNIYLSNKKSLNRKFAEIFFVDAFEKKYSKEEIFSLYVNIIYYGDGYYGIKDASMGYFGKLSNNLDLYEASLLAGLPQAPSKLQLSNGFTEINKRQKKVLDSMLKYGYINQQEYNDTLLKQPED